MLKGRIIEQGEKKQVLSPPHHEYTDKLLASVPEMDPDWLDKLLEERASAFMWAAQYCLSAWHAV